MKKEPKIELCGVTIVDFEIIRISYLSQLLETGDHWDFPWLDFDKLEGLTDRENSEAFSKILLENFNPGTSEASIMRNNYFRSFFAGLSLSDESLNMNVRKEIAREIIKNSDKFLLDLGTRCGYGANSKQDSEYTFYTHPDLVKWVFLCGLDGVTFLLRNTDFGSEIFYGVENPRKLLIRLGVIVEMVLTLNDAARDRPYQKLHEDTDMVETVYPLLAAIENPDLDVESLERFFEKDKFANKINLALSLIAPGAIAVSGNIEALTRVYKIISSVLESNPVMLLALDELSPVSHNIELLFGLFCENLPFETIRNTLQDYLLFISTNTDFGYLDTSSLLLSLASGLIKREGFEIKEDIIEFLLFLQNHEELSGAYLAGALVSREYGFESLELEFRRNLKREEPRYFLEHDIRELESEIGLLHKNPLWFFGKALTEYRAFSKRFTGIFSEQFHKNLQPHFEPIHQEKELTVYEYSVVPAEETMAQYHRDYEGKTLIKKLERLVERQPFSFGPRNELIDMYAKTGDRKALTKILLTGYARLREILPVPAKAHTSMVDRDLNTNFPALQFLSNCGQMLLKQNNDVGVQVLNSLLAIDQSDNFGARSSLIEYHMRKKDFGALEKLIYPDNSSATIEMIMVRVLIHYTQKSKDNAEIELINALNINAHLIDALLEKLVGRETVWGPGKATGTTIRGSRHEAVAFAETYGKYWKQLPGIISWLGHVDRVFRELI